MYRYKIEINDPAWNNWFKSLRRYRESVHMPYAEYKAHTQAEREVWQMKKINKGFLEAYLEFPSYDAFIAWHMSWS